MRPGERVASPPPVPAPVRELRVLLASGARPRIPFACRGRIARVPDGARTALVNILPVEDYLRGALAAEVPASWPSESLKAAAVVLRTYAVGRAVDRARDAWDLYPDSRDQMYRGRRGEDRRTDRAIAQTSGIVLRAGDGLIPGFHHACCGGHTADSREVYGVSSIRAPVAGVACRWCRRSKHWGPWTATFTWAQLTYRLGPLVKHAGRVTEVEAGGTTDSGRVEAVRVTAGGAPYLVPAAKFRIAMGADELRSTRFDVRSTRTGATFRGHGWGHGVGLCQEGAREMAREGRTWKEILATYFPDAAPARI